MANVTDKFKETYNGANPVSTTASGTRAIAGTSLALTSASGWPTNTGIDFVTYKKDVSGNKIAGSQCDWEGVLSGSTIGSMTLKNGTDAGNAIGDIVEMGPTASWANNLVKGLEAQHNQDGTHSAITSTAITNTGIFTQTGATLLNGSWDGWVGANEAWTFASSTTITVPTDATTKYDVGDFIKITQSATVKYFRLVSLTATVLTVAPLNGTDTVANSAITANAYSKAHTPRGTSPAWVSWTPTWANLTVGNGTVVAKYIQVGKTVIAGINFALGGTSSVGTSPTFTLPVTASSTAASFMRSVMSLDDSGNTAFVGVFSLNSTTIAGINVWDSNSTYLRTTGVTSIIPFTWGTSDSFYGTFIYEAA